MARQVYTIPIQNVGFLTGAHTFTIPEGFTYVARDIELVLRGSTYPTTFGLLLAAGTNLVFHEWTSSADNFWWQWEGRIAMPELSEWELFVGGSPVDIYITGYQLTLP